MWRSACATAGADLLGGALPQRSFDPRCGLRPLTVSDSTRLLPALPPLLPGGRSLPRHGLRCFPPRPARGVIAAPVGWAELAPSVPGRAANADVLEPGVPPCPSNHLP